MKKKRRSRLGRIIDFITFPLRAITLFENDKLGLSSLASERFDYVSREVEGYCLDVGCGRFNRFIQEYCNGNGKGIDVYKYAGLSDEHIVKDITHFPFDDYTFNTVTFIANFGHIPRHLRDIELKEAHRVLTPGGKIIITNPNCIASILVHKVVKFYDKIFKTKYDIDSERGMQENEDICVHNNEIIERLKKANFINIKTKYFWTQWFLNRLFIAEKKIVKI
ncbi:MAG: class I SAM-dependent methyltransferase [candidate division WOR-3 bacterium]